MRGIAYRLLQAGLVLTVILFVFGCGTYSDTVPVDGEPDTGNGLPPADDNDGASVSPPDIEMEIVNFTFSQETITVPVGTTVIWYNSDSAPHTSTTVDPLFDSGRLSTGHTFSYTFDQPGTYDYYCTIHPYMKATVIVE